MTNSVVDYVLRAENLSKHFGQGAKKVLILDKANFAISENESVALVGPSGCGKTTFLQILGLLDTPCMGRIIINGKDYSRVGDYTSTKCRRKNIGFIYQSYNLLSDFTALENVMFAACIQGLSKKKAIERSKKLLEEIGLKDRCNHFPSQLSGGEQQRVAIVRSIVHEPSLVLADEPTGNLDAENSTRVLDMLMDTVKRLKKSLIIVTHDMEIAKRADRILTINKGIIVEYKK